jgi:hypothetical protein
MAGIFHPYYSVALAPAIGALVAIGATVVWRGRTSYAAALVLGAAVALSAVFAFGLLGRTPDFLPWLRWVVLVVGLAAAFLLALRPVLPRVVALGAAGAAVAALLLGPASYAVETAATPHTGSIPSAGPTGTSFGGPGGMGRPAGAAFPGGPTMGNAPTNGFPGTPPGGATGTRGGSTGGLLQASEPSAAMTALLESDASSYDWLAAVVGSNSAAGYQLATEEPVMAIGGFNGSDPSPTLAEFQQYVAEGRIHYFIASGDGGGAGGFGGRGGMAATGSTSGEIADWVEQSFASTTVDGVTVYDLSGGAS